MSHFYERFYNRKINQNEELEKIKEIFEEKRNYYLTNNNFYLSLKDCINEDIFKKLPIAQNALSIDEVLCFIKGYSTDQFIDYIEFVLTLNYQIMSGECITYINTAFVDEFRNIIRIVKVDLSKLNLCIKMIDSKDCGEVCIIIPNDELLEEVLLVVDNSNIQDKLIEYRAMKNDGNIKAKEEILQLLSNYVEGILKDNSLKEMNGRLFKNTGFMLNNLNVRHNNEKENIKNPTKYYESTKNDREKWLDNYYELILLTIFSQKEKIIHEELEKLKKI